MNAYDLLDQVQIQVWLDTYADDPEVLSTRVLLSSQRIQGTGEEDPTEWTRDILIAVMEDL